MIMLTTQRQTQLKQFFAEAKRDGNPLLSLWYAHQVEEECLTRLFQKDIDAWRAEYGQRSLIGDSRDMLVRKYAWAVPSQAALTEIAKHGPILEMGAGTGYWASLLLERSVEIVAYDHQPPSHRNNHFHGKTPTFAPVKYGTPQKYVDDRTLMLCWPPMSPMAFDCLQHHRGRTLIYIGEGEGGCTGDEDFFRLRDERYEQTAEVIIPQFNGIHDYLSVWQRKA